jgi:hypothetical protein
MGIEIQISTKFGANLSFILIFLNLIAFNQSL